MNVNKININQSEPTYYIASDIYDVSYHNNDAVFESLQSLLSSDNLSTLIPVAVRCGGMSIRFIQTSDNKYVQYRLLSDEFTTDTTQWAIDDESVYVENPEFIRCYCDADGRLLWWIYKDGSVDWAKGLPTPIQEELKKLEQLIKDNTEENENVVARVTTNEASIIAINEVLDKKIDGEYIDGTEYIRLNQDTEGKILNGIRHDGFNYIPKADIDILSLNGTKVDNDFIKSTQYYDNPECLSLKIDNEDKIITAIYNDGTTFISKLQSPTITTLDKKIDTVNEDLQTYIASSSKKYKTIICWGDSLTAGAGSTNVSNIKPVVDTLVSMGYEDKWSSKTSIKYEDMLSTLLPDYKVVNCGVGGETLYTIAARQGAEPAFLPNEITIPTSKDEEVTIIEGTDVALGSLYKRDARVRPLIQGQGNSVNPIYVEGIECTLKVVAENYKASRYYLQRTKDGDRNVTIPAGTPIIMSGSKNYRNTDCAILWCWQNGGYTDNDDLVTQLKNMISHLPTDKYLIIGLHSGTMESRSEQEQLLEKTFGDKFFNWRRYVSTNALSDWGFTPTEEDESAMLVGSIPPTLLTDGVHLKASGYMILGYKMWERMTQLGYFD